jgi:hypothetical protein
MVVLCGFCALVIDYGVLLIARAQAQNAADAGALAGATALAFDSIVDDTVADAAALATVAPNLVWLEPPGVETTPGGGRPVTTIDPACVVPDTPPPSGNVYNCVTVRVYRDGQFGSTRLPTYFARLFNVNDQGVQAVAKGTAAPANSTACVWPLAIPDKWGGTPVWSSLPPPSTFVKYALYPALKPLPRNSYAAPTFSSNGTGYKLSQNTLNVSPNLTAGLTLTRFDPAQFTNTAVGFGITTTQFIPVVVPRSGGGGFVDNLASCNGVGVYIGDTLAIESGGTIAQATTAASARVAADPAATFNASTLRLQNSCAVTSACGAISPRLVVLPLFDVERFEDTRRSGAPVITIVNFVGLFINQVIASTSIQGYVATYPGAIDTTKPQVQYLSAFLRAGVLLR